MDIIPNNKFHILRRKRDETNGVVDLRRFSVKKRTEKYVATKKIVSEIRKIEREIATSERKSVRDPKKGLSHDEKKSYEMIFARLKSFACFISIALASSSLLFSLSYVQKTIDRKNIAVGAGVKAYDYLKIAGQSVANSDFKDGISNFEFATSSFSNVEKSIDDIGSGIAMTLDDLPVDTPISTAKNLAQAGKNIALAGKNIAELLDKIYNLDKNDFSAEFISDIRINVDDMAANLKNAEKNMKGVDSNYIPENLKEKIEMAKKQLPIISGNVDNLSKDIPVANEILAKAHPQKYLLLFENNSEMRATGGFIGSYGILDIENGKIKNIFINGVFDPDGQLNEKITPPVPIQKISAAWSMHDANWFADFPTSAKKVASFYEKTGGPTVDGVIAITPNVIGKILKITGPVDMPEYDTIITESNFLQEMQTQVEELYDKQKNKPKQFLSDLAPKIIEKLASAKNNLSARQKIQFYSDLISVAEESLKEKHIMLYHRNRDIENSIIKRGWGGQMLNSSGDYLSVVNSNINGYKTDAVIDEKITHNAEIKDDGSVIDTVTITRSHKGGNSTYDWYNRVNSDYMRIYVPAGSVLLEAKGHTIQEYEPPIDYSTFKTDPDIAKIENSIKIDRDSGTQIFEESGKTVFGNWVYVSPGEKVEVTYKYILPYKINFDDFTKPADKYSILVQKQSGSSGSAFSGSISLPYGWNAIWESDNLVAKNPNNINTNTDLKTDKIYGVVFMRESEK